MPNVRARRPEVNSQHPSAIAVIQVEASDRAGWTCPSFVSSAGSFSAGRGCHAGLWACDVQPSPGPIHGLHGQEWNRSNPSLAVQASDRLLVDAPVFVWLSIRPCISKVEARRGETALHPRLLECCGRCKTQMMYHGCSLEWRAVGAGMTYSRCVETRGAQVCLTVLSWRQDT